MPCQDHSNSWQAHLPQQSSDFSTENGHSRDNHGHLQDISSTIPMAFHGRDDEVVDWSLNGVSEVCDLRVRLNLGRRMDGPTPMLRRGLNVSSATTSRGIEGGRAELSQRLERFKVRTIDLGGFDDKVEDKR